MELKNALTVDVEDYYHVSGFEDHIDRGDWGRYESRVVASTHRVLAILDEHKIRGTFFVLGWVADRHPELVRDIHSSGHEIGSHGYWHQLVYRLTPEEFRADVARGRDVLEQLIGQPVVAYRAPSFSITRRSLWALDILASEGFRFDSSIFPVYHDRYGIPDARPTVHRIATASGDLWEFPISVHRVFGMNLPVSGGGYFRLFPLRWTFHCLSAINGKEGRPFVFYFHPWEIDAEQPRLRAGSRLSRARHYVNLARTERKLEALLATYPFGTLSEAIDTARAAAETIRLETPAASLSSNPQQYSTNRLPEAQ